MRTKAKRRHGLWGTEQEHAPSVEVAKARARNHAAEAVKMARNGYCDAAVKHLVDAGEGYGEYLCHSGGAKLDPSPAIKNFEIERAVSAIAACYNGR